MVVPYFLRFIFIHALVILILRLNSNLLEATSKLEWKLLQATTNNAPITLPTDLDFRELSIECRYAANCSYKWHITKQELASSARNYAQGFNNGDMNYAIIGISRTQVQLGLFYWQSTEIGGHCVTSVYYR